MPFYNKCCVPNCANVTCNIRHRFPDPNKHFERFRKWLQALNNPELNEMDPIAIYRTKRICHKHFEYRYISSTSQRLHSNALPTLLLEMDYESNAMPELNMSLLNSSSESHELLLEHNYGRLENEDPTKVQEFIAGLTTEELLSEHNELVNEDHMMEPRMEQGFIAGISEEPLSEHNRLVIEDPMKDKGFVAGVTERTGTVSNILSPLQILKHSGITKQTITPRKKKLYSAVKELHKKYIREKASKKSFKRRLFEAKDFGKKYQLEDNIGKLNTMAAILIRCQFRESDKSKNLRRFTLNEKFLSLLLYKQSPKSYAVLSKIFILPTKSTLNRLLGKIVGGPGINDHVFESLEETTKQMDPSEKYVAVLFDEMAIMPGFHFNQHEGFIEGFEDMGQNERNVYISDHVLMFMVRGIKKQWKSPISYHFSSRGGAKLYQTKQLLIEVIKRLILIGLKPITVICDQNNMSVINSLTRDTREKYLRNENLDKYRSGSFEIENHKLYPILDPPHLIKGIRNNFIKKDLIYKKHGTQKTAKWQHIQNLYELDNGTEGLRVLPHLTDEHIYENKLRKMKVKNAVQIFSQRFAATLRLVSGIDNEKKIGVNVEDTAEILYFFDRLFDSFNGSNKNPDRGKTLRCGLSSTSDHLRFWNEEALPLLRTMEFKKNSSRDQATPPSLKNWTMAINNVKSIWQILKGKGFSYLLTRRLNQDPLENAFGQLRSFGVLNNNPSASQFVGIFKTLFCNNALSFYKNTFSCEDDKCESLFISLKKLFGERVIPIQSVENTIEYSPTTASVQVELTLSDKLQQLSGNYVAGFILKKIKKNIVCSECRNLMFSNNYESVENILISAREYGGAWARRLCYPTSNFVLCFFEIYKIIQFCLDQKPYSRLLVHEIEKIVHSEVDFGFLTCKVDLHKKKLITLILKFMIKTLVHYWCKNVNNILLGKTKRYTGSNIVKLEAAKIYLNRTKKKNAKKPEHLINASV